MTATRERPNVTGNRVFSYQTLKTTNESSVRRGRNQNFFFAQLPIHDDGTVYPTVFAMVHNDREVRAKIIFNADGDTGLLDMSFAEWDALPTMEAFVEKRDELFAEGADNA